MRSVWNIIAAILAIGSVTHAGTIAIVKTPSGIGTAFCVHVEGDISYWVTAAHVVEEGESVQIGYNVTRVARVIGRYPSDEIVVLETARDHAIDSAYILGDATTGESVTGCGYAGGDKPYAMATGSVGNAYESRIEGKEPTEMAVVQTCFRSGMSGGPVLARGRCVGMVYGSDSKNPVQSVLITSRPMLVRLTQCFNGRCQQWQPQYYVRPLAPTPPIYIPPQPRYQVTPATPQPIPQATIPPEFDQRLTAIEQALSELRGSVVQGPPGERGPAGLPGPTGATGLPGPGPTDAQVAVAVDRWMRANVDQVRGPAGETGPKGTVTVIVQDREQVKTFPDLTDGREVTVPIDRITRVNQ